MKRLLYGFLLTLVSVFLLAEVPNYYTTRELNSASRPKDINWISVEQIEEKLKGKPPMAVGFDVDDTLLCNSTVTRAIRLEHPEVKDVLKIPGRYVKLNCSLLKYQPPKVSGQKLIDMHQRRGDTLYFITARRSGPCVTNNAYSLKDYLKETFSVKKVHDVIYTGPSSKGTNAKTPWIKQKGIEVYYGDDDMDIEAAQEAGILGIRVMRPSMSERTVGNRIGFYNELVLEDSDY